MSYQPTSNFSWDQVFRPERMSRLIDTLGFRNDRIVRLLNYLQYGLVILFFIPFFPVAWTIRFLFGQYAVQRCLYMIYGGFWLTVFGVYRRVWYHPAIRKDEGYVFMSEHFSLMDVPLFGTTWPVDTRALAAKEHANIPFYGWMLRTIGSHFVDRKDTQKAIADMQTLKGRMETEGISICVMPTGTRAPDWQMPLFKKGVFHLAVQLQRPIVPMYLVGLENLRIGKNFCRPGRVDVVYGEPIRPENHPAEFADASKLMDFMRERMLNEARYLRRERTQFIGNEIRIDRKRFKQFLREKWQIGPR